MTPPPASHLLFDSPANYQISVRGQIPASWANRLESMAIHREVHEGSPPVTVLVGELADQAALAGVLNTLYELHLPVLSVQLLSAR